MGGGISVGRSVVEGINIGIIGVVISDVVSVFSVPGTIDVVVIGESGMVIVDKIDVCSVDG